MRHQSLRSTATTHRAHGTTGARRFSIGGVASKLAHHAETSLLIVREGD